MNSFWSEKRTIVALALSILTLAEIVDLTIVGVALPDIMGSLGANINEISLTMTSYIVASAIFIPLTGIVSAKYGSKFVSLASALVFGIASVLCGMATTLVALVVFRIIQGIGGAFLPSMSQSYIVKNFTAEEKPKIMTIYSLCVILGPVIGPIFGGLIVENMSWRWIFFVNVPICIAGFVLVYLLMEETAKENVKTDYLSFIFMACGIGFLEYFLDEGNQNNWLESQKMVIILAIGIISIIFFIWRARLGKSVINLQVFKNKNFVLSCFTIFCFMTMAVLAMAYFPTLLQQGYGYPVDLAGYISSPRGVCAFIAAPIFIMLAKKFDPRRVMFFGLLTFTLSCFLLLFYGTNNNKILIITSVAMQGIGLTGTFVILIQAAFTGLALNLSNDASGVFNFFRNIGNSIGTSIAATVITQQQQVAWHDMSEHVSRMNNAFNSWGHNIPLNIKTQFVAQQIKLQSFLIANLNVFYISLVGMICILWVPFFLAKPKMDGAVDAAH